MNRSVTGNTETQGPDPLIGDEDGDAVEVNGYIGCGAFRGILCGCALFYHIGCAVLFENVRRDEVDAPGDQILCNLGLVHRPGVDENAVLVAELDLFLVKALVVDVKVEVVCLQAVDQIIGEVLDEELCRLCGVLSAQLDEVVVCEGDEDGLFEVSETVDDGADLVNVCLLELVL